MQLPNTARCLLAAAGVAVASLAGTATAQSVFTYQGVLEEGGSPVTGLENIRFRIFDAQTGGNLFGETTQNVDVEDGVFSAELNFGPLNLIDPNSAWLEIAVNTGSAFETLGRQRITSAPFSTNTRGMEVEPSGQVSFTTNSPNSGTMFVENTSSTGFAGTYFVGPGGGLDGYVGVTSGGPFTWIGGDGMQIGSATGQDVIVTTGSAERMRVTSGGNVGIGTDAPARRLDVRSNGLTIGGSALSGDTSVVMAANDPNIDIVGLDAGSELGGISFKEVDGAGLLSDSWSWHRRTSGAGSPLRLTYGSSPNAWVNPSVMTFLPSGNVGIGTSNPGDKLEVAGGDIVVTDSVNPGIRLDNTNDADTSWFMFAANNDLLRFRDSFNAIDVVRFVRAPLHEINLMSGTSGNVRATLAESANRTDCGRIFTLDETNSINNLMDVQSDGTAFMATTEYLTFSDVRLKENIETIENPIETIRALRGVTYDHKDGSGYNDIGFIAQEVEEVLPQLVSVAANDMKSVEYSRMTALLVEAVKVQQAEIDALKAQRSVVGASMVWPVLLGGGVLGGLAVARRRMNKA